MGGSDREHKLYYDHLQKILSILLLYAYVVSILPATLTLDKKHGKKMCYVRSNYCLYLCSRKNRRTSYELFGEIVACKQLIFFVVLVINISFIFIVLQYTALISYTCILNFIHSASEMSHKEGDPVVEVGVHIRTPPTTRSTMPSIIRSMSV